MSFREVWYGTGDGLRLYARDYGRDGALIPVLCLPGLTRNAKDFDILASRLAHERRVICPDFRGRGKSQYADDPLTYRADVEMADTLALLDHLGTGRVAVIGTSRGGLVAMLMAAAVPERVAGMLLNDIGPHLMKEGLLRIRSYLGRAAPMRDWADAVAAMKSSHSGFETLPEAEWEAFARRVFRDENGIPHADYDPMLALTFPRTEDIEAGKVPELWHIYEACAAVPVTVLRGENSDLLSAETAAEMVRRHADAELVTVAGRGHVPFLDEPESWAAVKRFLSRAGCHQTAT